jgi:hypothetical protein
MHKREILGERVDLSRLENGTSQNSTTFMIIEQAERCLPLGLQTDQTLVRL